MIKTKYIKYIVIGIVLLAVAIVGIKMWKKYDRTFYMNKPERIKYIDAVDNVSKNKLQINWREVAAVDAAMNNRKIKSTTDEHIENLSKNFLTKEENGKYKLNSMDDVLTKVDANFLEKKMAHKFLRDINKQREIKDPEKREFIDSLKDEAIKVSNETGILPSVILGQATLESNWGKADLASRFNNLFGIKANPSWTGKKAKLETSEYNNKVIDDYFRVYDNKKDSLDDYGEFMVKNPRYRNAGVFDAGGYREQIKAIENSGYSTITNESGEKVYAKYVLDIIRSYDLQLLDWKAAKK